MEEFLNSIAGQQEALKNNGTKVRPLTLTVPIRLKVLIIKNNNRSFEINK